jgi:hypothetical protein
VDVEKGSGVNAEKNETRIKCNPYLSRYYAPCAVRFSELMDGCGNCWCPALRTLSVSKDRIRDQTENTQVVGLKSFPNSTPGFLIVGTSKLPLFFIGQIKCGTWKPFRSHGRTNPFSITVNVSAPSCLCAAYVTQCIRKYVALKTDYNTQQTQ